MYDMIKEGNASAVQSEDEKENPSDLSDWEVKINEIESQK